MTVIPAPARPRRRLLTAILLVLLAITSVGCAPEPHCDFAPFSDTIVAKLIGRKGATATFVVASVTKGFVNPTAKNAVPAIEPGDRTAVRYAGGQAQFLHVGLSYRVGVWWFSNHFESGVHVAGVCSTGTAHADGTAINTSIWSRSWVRQVVVLSWGVVALVLVALAVGLLRMTRRRRRR